MEPQDPITLNDSELILRAVNGDEDSLVAALKAVGPQVARRIRVSDEFRGSFDADDVMQVAYLEAFLRIGDLRNSTLSGFTAWLTRLAENSLKDAVKELTRQRRPDPRRRISSEMETGSSAGLLEALGWCSATPSRQAAEREADKILNRTLPSLPESYEQVIRLFDLKTLPPQEVAREMGRSVGAVYMLRARALHRLAELIGPESRFFSDPA